MFSSGSAVSTSALRSTPIFFRNAAISFVFGASNENSETTVTSPPCTFSAKARENAQAGGQDAASLEAQLAALRQEQAEADKRRQELEAQLAAARQEQAEAEKARLAALKEENARLEAEQQEQSAKLEQARQDNQSMS